MIRSATSTSNIHYSEDKNVVILKYTIPLGNACNPLVPELSAWSTVHKTQDLNGHQLLWFFMADDLGDLGCLSISLHIYEGHLENKERFAIQRYLLIIGKKQNMQVLSHTFTYFST